VEHPAPSPAPEAETPAARLHRARTALLGPLVDGVPGSELSRAWSAAVGGLIGERGAAILGALPRVPGRVAIVAHGALGREQLSPFSDVDLAVVCEHDPGESAAFAEWMRSLLHPLWDAGLSVAAVVHDVAGWLDAAVADLPLCTSLLDLRPLAGDGALVERLRGEAQARFFGPARAPFVDRLREEVRARHARYGSTVYRVEPDLKFGPGGARDLAVVAWVLRAAHGTDDLEHLAARGLVGESTARALSAARDVVLRLRTALQLAAGRPQDRLVFQYQEKMPALLGLVQRGPVSDAALVAAIEAFMMDYYRSALDVLRHGPRVVRRALPPKEGAQVEVRLDERFCVRDRRLAHYGVDPFAERPALALEALALARDHDAGLAGETLDCVVEALASADAEALADDPRAQRAFLDLLVDPRHAGLPTPLELAHEVGAVERLVPEFAASRGRMQHDSFHVYTVDRHSLYAVEFLKAVARGEWRKDYPMATAVHLGLDDLRPLYLATLLHDAGKPFGEQCEQGAAIAGRAAERAELEPEDRRRCAFLVAEHLTMPMLSQRRDLSDPLLIEGFAARVVDKRTLDELYLLSLADMAAVSPDYLTTWKVTLLDELYLATAATLRHRAHRAAAATGRRGGDEPEGLPQRYYSLFDVGRRRSHRVLIERARASAGPSSVDVGEGAGGALRLTVVARDRPGLLAHLTAVLDEFRLPVLAADIFSVPGHPVLALDVFRVMPDAASEIGDGWVGAFEARLSSRLSASDADDELGRAPPPLPRPAAAGRRPISTKVRFSSDPAGQRSIVEVETADQPGVLRRITAAFARVALDIEVARVLTEARRALDTFYVRALDRDEQVRLETTLIAYLERSPS
jgi:[protein-PII] uridylyltransferase